MKKILTLALAASLWIAEAAAQEIPEWKIVTVIESIVPGGLGRSRMIENMTEINTEEFRRSRTDGKKTNGKLARRSEMKVDEFDEAKLLNFFSIAGINFQNVASNDAMIGARIMELSAEGWKLAFVTSAVESDAGKQDGQGIFITRMFFSRPTTPKDN
jgi:hypothetical protein